MSIRQMLLDFRLLPLNRTRLWIAVSTANASTIERINLIVMWVLQIDNDQDDLDIFGAAVNFFDAGIKYYGVETLEGALALLDKDPATVPDVIFLDINMPRYSGFECYTFFKKDSRFRHTRFVFLSTTINEKDIPPGCDVMEK